MIFKRVLLLCLTTFVVLPTLYGQTIEELVDKANSYFKAGSYAKAKEYYQRVIEKGDAFHVEDCKQKIRIIDDLTYKANKSAPFGLTKDKVFIPYQGGDAVVSVNGGGSWKIAIDSDWCEVRKDGNQIIITSKANENLEMRTVEVKVTKGTQVKHIMVTNAGAPERFFSTTGDITFPSSGDTNTIDIEANTNWDIKSKPEWISANKENGKLVLTAAPNEKNSARYADVKIESPTNSIIIINIFQSAGREELSVSDNNIKFSPEGGEKRIKVYTNAAECYVGNSPDWCDMVWIENTDSIKINCHPNKTFETREGSAKVNTALQTLGIHISQEASPYVMQVPDIGIGGRAISMGINAGYIMPTISSSAGGKYVGSPINYGLGTKQENASYSSPGGFSVGLYADIRLYKNLYLKAGIDYLNYSYENKFENRYVRNTVFNEYQGWYMRGEVEHKYREEYSMSMLEIPVLVSYRLPVSKLSHIQFNLGPVISYGLSAKLNVSGSNDSEKIYKYKYVNHQMTGLLFDNEEYNIHTNIKGEINLYDNKARSTETYLIGTNVDTKTPDILLDDAPYKRLNFGAKAGVVYEYAGIHLGIEYNVMFSNMANDKYWNGDRWKIFGQTSSSAMSGYKQRNGYLAIKLGYTFRY